LVIIEESTNYPTILGRKNIPPEKRWGAGRNISTLPSVIAAGLDRSFLPQRILKRPRLLRMRQGDRGNELSLHTDYDVQLHNAVHAQTEKNIPLAWGPREWRPGALIQNLPSVIQTGAGVEGPSRTMHPKMIPTGLSVEI